MKAPTASELLNQHTVRQALESAWLDSQPDSQRERHEEGGWIYMDMTTGLITVRRVEHGGPALIDLNHPPLVAGSVVVGKFHTHPNPTSDGWEPGPSKSDRRLDQLHGVPDLIRSDSGVYFSGPERRRGGISGSPGYTS